MRWTYLSKSILLVLGLSLSILIQAQHVINYEIEATGLIELSENISIPKINSGYTCWFPDVDTVLGLVVFFHARRDTVNADEFIEYALQKKIGVLYLTTENRVDFLFEKEEMQQMESFIREVITRYSISPANMIYCGMSLAGTRALRLVMFANTKDSEHKIVPGAVAICDAPLDMIRFYRQCIRALELNASEIAVNEASWVSSCLSKNLGGPAHEQMQAYLDYSPFSHDQVGYNYLSYLDGVAVRAYTEPDVAWWMANRQKDYYGMNALDMAGMINGLRIRNNKSAELITTIGEGFRPDGERHPHSWSIVDEKELIDWFAENVIQPD